MSAELMRRPARSRGLAVAVLAVAMLAQACTGFGERDDPQGEAGGRSSRAAATLLDPASFAARMTRPEAFVINVHVPYEGELEATDAFIPFDHIGGDARLPTDKNAEILLYCRSGSMSRTAGEALAAEGYTDLYDLDGGMRAWQASGRQLITRP